MSKEECYKFEFDAKISGYGIVYANCIEDARRIISNGDYDDILETYDMEIIDITKIEESDE